MQRYFVSETGWGTNEVTILGEDVHHINRVMRYKEGANIICNHPDGRAAICELLVITADSVQAEIKQWLNENVELPIQVTVAQGLPKGDKLELILQKGTELGAYAFIPFQAERSIVNWDKKKQEKKLIRFNKIVKEASEQSHRNQIPTIYSTITVERLIEESSKYDVKLYAYEEQAKVSDYKSFGTVLENVTITDKILICIGPEGGFSPIEAEKLNDNGFQAIRLGPRILRTETAALYALASISYHFEELRCDS
ncbi:16S rRNA (uracil(1498)-N(3))-methyltransferase [Virgibacillus halodenitrificans]|uniref:16S rRNA (uracil(1498)-N(3))-methyltransferase n=1 Tax=Virgibacillus halodenitrificans TaxID=1482 RepID=UPI001FB4B3AE|nr:16S rRNA (uracil(1498)-N(3))-methyltransferase [Virgibacillus halodenitrificans]MCJ0930818.1 16S rRNA (uracil(1498)-N(3))-methyltransferase [Virgibacillus halodenitrificans]